jgi:plasmid stability protein
MSDLILRDVPADVWTALHARAHRHGQSCEDEVLQLIHRAVQEEQLLEELDRATAAMAARLTRTEPLLSAKRQMPRRHQHDAPTPASDIHR